MKKIIVGTEPGTIIIQTPAEKKERLVKDKKPALTKPMSKGIFNRIADIVVEDIKAKFGVDKKSIQSKNAYEDFMNEHFPGIKR